MISRIGQKVAFIGNMEEVGKKYGVNVPVTNRVYTVRGFENRGDGPGILLMEISNRVRMHNNGIEAETCFAIEFFRPLTERKTDIGIFKRMLKPTKQDA